ncbi:hypothetical protein OAK99_01300 [Akkermansiaceae bacterium]|nr:hypothetical protein [Akkermansiaceae bacterium]
MLNNSSYTRIVTGEMEQRMVGDAMVSQTGGWAAWRSLLLN